MNDRTVLAVFIASIVFGGSNAVAIRIGNGELPPFFNATLRFAIAGAIFAVIAVFVRPPLPRRRTLVGVVAYGLLNFAGTYAFGYLALVSAPAGAASVIIAVAPLFTFGLAIAHGLERFRWEGLLGAVVALAGIAVVSGEQLRANVPLVAVLAALGMALCLAEGSVLAKVVSPGHPVSANLFGMIIGGVVLGALSLASGERWALPVEPRTWASVLYIASIGSVLLFLAFLFVLRRWSASATSYIMLLMPLWTVSVAAVLLGERVSPTFAVGAALVLAGTYIGAFMRPKTKRAPTCKPPECVPVVAAEAAS